MKFNKILISSAILLAFVCSTLSKSLKRKGDGKCKKQYDDCTYKSLGSECCDGLVCDVYFFSIPDQGFKHYDIKDKNKGKCKLKQDKPCDRSDAELKKMAPCKYNLLCSNYILQTELGTHCIPRSSDPKLLD